MNSDQEQSGSRSTTGRAEAFNDGVLAIVITLLVLDLHPPHGQPGQLLSGLLQQWPTYLAYAAAGGVLGGLLLPAIGLAILVILPIYYGITSHGLSETPRVLRRITPGRT